MEDEQLLRVHSEDLHDHVAQEVGECLSTGLYTDTMIRCKDGLSLHAHKLVLSAASPFLKMLFETNDWEEVQTLELPEIEQGIISLLLEIVYNGVVEATIEDLRSIILLAHSLYIAIPLSDELLETLEVELPQRRPFMSVGISKIKQRPNLSNNAERLAGGVVPPLRLKLPFSAPVVSERKKQPDVSDAIEPSPPLSTLRRLHRCPICTTDFGTLGSFKLHMKAHDNDSLKDQRNGIIAELVANCYDTSISLYTCSICSSQYNHSGNFKQHLLKHEREQGSISSILLERGVDPELMPKKDTHLNTVLKSAMTDRVVRVEKEGANSGYQCEDCGRSFNHAGNFKQHLMSHMRTSPASMALARKQMAELIVMQSANKRSKFNNSAFLDLANSYDQNACLECQVEFTTPEELEEHNNFTHKNGIEVQHEDAITFEDELIEVDQDYFNGSQRSNTSTPQKYKSSPIKSDREPALLGQRRFKCKECGRVFHTKKKLQFHIRIHTNPEVHYRFPCDICGKKFTRQQHVNRHKLLHTGAKTFQCPKCEKNFLGEDQFKVHIRTECKVVKEDDEDTNGDDPLGDITFDEQSIDQNGDDYLDTSDAFEDVKTEPSSDRIDDDFEEQDDLDEAMGFDAPDVIIPS